MFKQCQHLFGNPLMFWIEYIDDQNICKQIVWLILIEWVYSKVTK